MTNDERDRKIEATHDAVIAIQTACVVCCATVAGHDESLRGNGRPGLTLRVAKLEWFKMLCCSIGGGIAGTLFVGFVAWGFGKL